MKKTILLTITYGLLSACGGGSSSSPTGNDAVGSSGGVQEWQKSFAGQEGHGGDAVVCFNIPVSRALEKVGEKNNSSNCKMEVPCSTPETSVPQDGSSASSGVYWRITAEGRSAIVSAKPLEQYIAERTNGKETLLKQLNQMSVEDGYAKVLEPFASLPGAGKQIKKIHQKLGWLTEDGIASEFGLRDVNDSGFLNETEIDTNYCSELQAVVRRDNQLWYDASIVKHFDNAGKVLMQIHEEIYTWGKWVDQMNAQTNHPAYEHKTSAKTRRLIMKVLDAKVDIQTLNENLKTLAFSILYSLDMFNTPTSVGYYMDTGTCIKEQKILRNLIFNSNRDKDLWLSAQDVVLDRYLKSDRSWAVLELRHNYPEALSNIISFILVSKSSSTFRQELMALTEEFEKPESCVGF